jgi:AcrR family transcriptional regulator
MPRKNYHHGDLKRAALDLAEAMLEEQPDLSMRFLSSKLGVAHRALYNHFTDRSGLMALIAARSFEQLATSVSTENTPAGFIRAYAAFALARPQHYANMMRQSYDQFETHTELRTAADKMIASALAVLAPHAANADDGRRTVMRLWMLVHGGLELHAAGVLHKRNDDAFVTELLAIAGLAESEDQPNQALWTEGTKL